MTVVPGDLVDRPAWEIRDLVASRQVSASETVEASLSRIERDDGALHSFLTVCGEEAVTEAKSLDRRLATGEPPGPLCGVPVSVKDLYWTKGVRTTYGSLVFTDHVPTEDAVAVARLRAAGAVLVGKTNTPEFGIFIRTTNRLAPETRNPWDLDRSPGGSSGGAAANVAAGLTPVALGSDGGGSIRIPAALCGVMGLLPTGGAVPNHGGFIGTRRFSVAGPIARCAKDLGLMLAAVMGPDRRDFRSLQVPRPDLHAAADGLVGLRLRQGAIRGDTVVTPAIATAVDAAVSRLEAAGASVNPTPWHYDPDRWRVPFYQIMMADRLATGGRELLADPQKATLLTDYAAAQLEMGVTVTGADYAAALILRDEARRALRDALSEVDLLVLPTVGVPAPAAGQGTRLPDEARRAYVALTYIANFTGLPAVSMPCGLVADMPVGLQAIARPGGEATLLRLCAAVEGLVGVPHPPEIAHGTEPPGKATRA